MDMIEISLKHTANPGFVLQRIPGLKLLNIPHRQIEGEKFEQRVLADFSNNFPQTAPDLLLNGDFSEGLSGWSITGDWVLSGENLTVNSVNGESELRRTLALETNTSYLVRVTIPDFERGTLEVELGGSVPVTINSAGDHFLFIRTATGSELKVISTDAELVLSFVSVKVLSGSNNGILSGGMENNLLENNPGIKFDGIDDFVSFGDVLSPREYDVFMFIWLKVTGSSPLAEKMEVVSKGAMLQFLTVDVNGNPGFYLNSGNYRSETASINITDGEWHFLTFRHSLTDGTKINVDNVITSSLNSVVINSLDYSEPLVFGKYPLGRYFKGFMGISGIAIYDGLSGAPSEMPENIAGIAGEIFRGTKHLYQ